LSRAGTHKDLESAGIQLREGLELLFYSEDADDQGRPDDLLVEGVVHYDEAARCWVAAVDWNALRHASDEQNLNGDQPTQAPVEKRAR
jgi:hypothetical protein